MQAVYTKLHTWLDGLTPAGCPVIITNQNAPTPARPFAAFRIVSVTDTARDYSENVRDLNEDQPEPVPPAEPLPPVWAQDVVRFVRFTVDVQIHARPGFLMEAEEIAQTVMDRAYDRNRNVAVLGRSVAFQLVVSAPQTVDAVIGAEFEPRVVFTLGFAATRDLVYDVGAIDTVIMTGQVETQTVQSEASE